MNLMQDTCHRRSPWGSTSCVLPAGHLRTEVVRTPKLGKIREKVVRGTEHKDRHGRVWPWGRKDSHAGGNWEFA